MPNRRSFIRTVTGAAAGLAVSRSFPDADAQERRGGQGRGQAPRASAAVTRREVQIGGRRVRVVDEDGALDGIATIQAIERALLDNRPGATLESVASRPVLTAFSDDSLSQAAHRMGVRDLGQLPVVAEL